MTTLAELYVMFKANADDLEKGMGKAQKGLEGWSSSATKLIGGAVAGAALAAGAAIVGVGTAAFSASVDFDAASKKMQSQLGLNEIGAKNFDETMRKVFGNNFGESIEDVSQSLVDVETAFGRIGGTQGVGELQYATEAALALRDAFGVDVAESTNAATELMAQFGLSAEESFDFIASGFQKGLNSSDDFLDTIGEYSTQFANGGADASQFFSVMETGLQGGVLGTDKAADAFKEFRIRLSEGSDGALAALNALGLDGERIFREVFEEGSLDAIDAFTMVTEAIGGVEDPSARMAAGVALIGTQFEDLGDAAIAAITDTNDWAAGSEGAISSLNAQYDTFGSAVEGIWRRLVTSISPFTDKLLELVNDAMPSVMGAFDAFDAAVGPTMTVIGTAINTTVDFVKGLFSGFATSVDDNATGPLQYWREWADTNLPYLQQIFESVLGAIQGFWNLFGEDILRIVNNTFNTAWTLVDTIMRDIGDVITLALQLITGDFEGAEETLNNIITRTWEAIKTIFSNQLDSIKTVITTVDWAGIGSAIMEGIANGIRNGANRIRDAAENAARSAYEAAKSWLGINSPSKKFEELGEFSAKGYEEGIKANIANVGSGVMGGLGGLLNTMQPAPVAAGASFTIHVNLSGKAGYEDGRQVGRGVSDELRARGY